MTVKCLSPLSKGNIALDFQLGYYSINELADHFSVSRRTIIRVLEERGIDPGIRRRPAPPPVIQTKIVEVPVYIEVPKVLPAQDPWYVRALTFFTRGLKYA